ncbi:YbbC/YhhH family protein [Riemerella anatipestifer]|uniref:NTF2 fold domain-containing protein n=1 Tax=Riemerella anatipestifer RA-CH-1 TaxID=1228997 RepID=J9QSQ3_RIEAN|nr:YbbC/YhhH family protein [Riemerella anatipestifer]AFR34881.1 hypothetical protein B739_0274 [Riemerella anatipestifer RA-CH-1]AIH01883.1 hypothetical protein M949_0712 [Riemerella anatipestifer CH3]MCO7332494.1 YbbC/YhhH family protein [Riemerella anatipestifer]MCO7351324.1 YbbC/YhhH family protein [Riemerella anatipestifer]MCU7583658.1 YbbC/YhhH family protein [Riemerella anatipestifer]
MKRSIIIVLVLLLVVLVCFYPKERYKLLNSEIVNCDDCLVVKEKMAVDIAEIILFECYGRKKIKSERPYSVVLKNNRIWIIKGSLELSVFEKIIYMGMPKLGGSFEIFIDGKDGRVIKMIHYK